MKNKDHIKHNHVYQLRHEPISQLRIGIIGLGNRGIATLKRYLQLMTIKVEIVALADLDIDNIHLAQQILLENQRAKATTYTGPSEWKNICEDPHVNLIVICTDWLSHSKIAIRAMECHKHVAIEVPLSTKIDECWELVKTAERTRMHCTMLENCCYDPFSLNVLNLVKSGVLGEISHVEGAYIHDLRSYYVKKKEEGGTYQNWSLNYCLNHTGNPYPTHGLGPLAKILGLNETDHMVSLSSHSSRQRGFTEFITNEFGGDTLEAQLKFKMGDMNTTIIKTAEGKTIMLQYSISLPRPYSRNFSVCGTLGFAQKYPQEVITLSPNGDTPLSTVEMNQLFSQYEHPWVTNIGKVAQAHGIDNTMNYMMDYRLMYCLQQGLPLDISIYDAAQWSCITELSEKSVLENGKAIDIPTFFE